MKLFLVVCLCVVLSVAVFAADDGFENFDVENIVKDDTKMKAIFDCMLDRAPCGDYQKLKDQIAEMMSTDCSECDPKKKANYDLGKKLVAEKYPKEFEEVVKKYALKSE